MRIEISHNSHVHVNYVKTSIIAWGSFLISQGSKVLIFLLVSLQNIWKRFLSAFFQRKYDNRFIVLMAWLSRRGGGGGRLSFDDQLIYFRAPPSIIHTKLLRSFSSFRKFYIFAIIVIF